MKSIYSLFTLCTLSLCAVAAEQISPPVFYFFSSGFTVQAPPGATQLELRVVDPARNLIFSETTNGEDIYFATLGSETSGEYRYEAVVVVSIDGQFKQRTSGGGFEIQGGILIGPPDPEEISAREIDQERLSSN